MLRKRKSGPARSRRAGRKAPGKTTKRKAAGASKRLALRKRRLGRGSLRRRSASAVRMRGSYRAGYEQGYAEGHARGFEDALQEAYARHNGTAVAEQAMLNAYTGLPVSTASPHSAGDLASVAGARIGIVYICTGKYNVFWEEFYQTAETHFLPGYAKTYYVFTDAPSIAGEEQAHVRRIYQANLGWPGNSLMRFSMFASIQETLRAETDFVYFFNSNMKFEAVVSEEALPIHEGIVALNHYAFYNAPPDTYPYDRNPACAANIPLGSGSYYFAGALIGGRTEMFLQISNELAAIIYQDTAKGIMALWFDESYFNQYLLGKSVRILDPSYGYADGWTLPFPVKIMLRDKNKWGGYDVLRQ
jgi:hypothetical protein